MTLRESLRRAVRPSTTRGTLALLAKSALNAVLFFGIFMLALPWFANFLLPMQLPVPAGIRTWPAGALALAGFAVWIICLDAFSRHGRGTPLAADAPRHLITTGPFARIRNPIMAAELAIIWAEALYIGSLGVALFALAMTVSAHWLVVHIEEAELHARFGESYAVYCRKVPRWFPRLPYRHGA
jgi:protein-S-isoprenylcysteine O-methyltransferase Ste14